MLLINLESPLGACYKDKFIIRHYSPVFTLGGGEVLFTANKKNNFISEQSMKLSEISNLIDIFNNSDDDYYIKIKLLCNNRKCLFRMISNSYFWQT